MQLSDFFRQHRNVIVLAASRYAADDEVRAACEGALLGVNRYTVREMVYALSSDRMNALGLSPISSIARDALAAAVARACRLEVLHEASGFPGFAGALSRTLRDLRLARVRPAGGRTGSNLAKFLDAYESELHVRQFADYPMRVELAIEEARSMPAPAMVVLGLPRLSIAEQELLDVLVSRAPEALTLGSDSTAGETCLEAVKRFALSGIAAPERAADSSFTFLSASSESLECVEIAREILHGDAPFDEVAVLLRNPQRHGPLIREAFERAGVPAWFTQGAQKPHIAGRAFVLLLRFREERFSAKRFCEFLSLQRHARWERLIRQAGVIAGAPRWRSRLEALPVKNDEDARALDELCRFALPLIDLLASLPDRACWNEWIERLREVAEFAGLGAVDEVLDELAPLGDMGPVSSFEVLSLLERSLDSYREPEVGTRYGKVFVAPIEDARGMEFRAVYIPGLNEGMFPKPPREDPLLLDEQRRALGMQESQNDHELLKLAVNCATERLFASCARLDLASGRERVPSFYAAELLKAARGSSADVSKLLKEAENKSERKIGWSAPSDPLDSIDEAEYDLATYRKVFESPKDARPGAYAWIRSLNPHTGRAIQARIERWAKDWSPYDGLSGTDVHVSELLQKSRLVERAYSVSGLQQFARCPYRFYLSQIVGLKPSEEPDSLERMDALVRGQLYHRVLFHWFRNGQQDLDEIVNRLADELAQVYVPPVPGVWNTEVEKLRADLLGWIATRDSSWEAKNVELSFGLADMAERDPESIADCVVLDGGFKLRGSIDLVEQQSRRLRVIDHKTGKFRFELRNCLIGGGEVLQPVLYALAVEAILGEAPGQAVLSYATLRGGYQTIPIRIDDEARRRVKQVLGLIDQWVDKAFLPAAPKKDGCKTCEFLPVCGPYEELRVAEKDQSELTGLTQIRRLT